MDEVDRVGWLEAIHELHGDCVWFRDKRGVCFSFLWYASLKEAQR